MQKEKVNNIISPALFFALTYPTQWISFERLIYRKALFKSVVNKGNSLLLHSHFNRLLSECIMHRLQSILTGSKGRKSLHVQWHCLCWDMLEYSGASDGRDYFWFDMMKFWCLSAHTFNVIHPYWPVPLDIHSIQLPHMQQTSIAELCIHDSLLQSQENGKFHFHKLKALILSYWLMTYHNCRLLLFNLTHMHVRQKHKFIHMLHSWCWRDNDFGLWKLAAICLNEQNKNETSSTLKLCSISSQNLLVMLIKFHSVAL